VRGGAFFGALDGSASVDGIRQSGEPRTYSNVIV
jgi:hypothetical protein